MTKEIQKGTVICQSGQPADSIHMIIKGTVRAIYQGGEYLLEKGDVIAIIGGFPTTAHTNFLKIEQIES